MPRAARTTGVALAVGAAVAAGCGGDGGPSREEFTQSANAICERHTAPIRQAAGRLLAGGQLPDPREFMQLARGTIIPQYSAQVRELQGLQPPEGLSQDFQRFLEASASARQQLMRNPAAITNPASFREVNRQAQQLGLSRDCLLGPT